MPVKLARTAHRDPARGLGENAFAFGEQLDSLDHFLIGDIFRPSPAVANGANGIVAIGRIADRERTGNGRRFLRLNFLPSRLDRTGDGRASGSLRSEELHRLCLYQIELDQLRERLFDLGDQRPAGHRNNYVVGQAPAKLFGNFETHRF